MGFDYLPYNLQSQVREFSLDLFWPIELSLLSRAFLYHSYLTTFYGTIMTQILANAR